MSEHYQYLIKLRNTKTGESTEHQDNYDYGGDQDLMLFQWLENNFSCDCNRSIFMYDDEDKELPCSGDPTIVIDWIKNQAGDIVWSPTDDERK